VHTGPHGTWFGGREKAPAAFLRKALTSTEEFEMWGDGMQTRSFCYVDDAVEGLLRVMTSAYSQPLNVGSDEMVSMNDMAEMSMEIAGEVHLLLCVCVCVCVCGVERLRTCVCACWHSDAASDASISCRRASTW
jgi:nucleoside-diphosphate-sugar epimerase